MGAAYSQMLHVQAGVQVSHSGLLILCPQIAQFSPVMEVLKPSEQLFRLSMLTILKLTGAKTLEASPFNI